jgi:hypothetical protein
MEKCDVTWGDFLEYLELFFNGKIWCGMRWCDMIVEFLELFFNRARWCVAWGDFLELLELFFNRESWFGMLLEFLELFFNGERWCGMKVYFSWVLQKGYGPLHHTTVHGNTPHWCEEYYRPQPHCTLAHKLVRTEVILTLSCFMVLWIVDVVLNFCSYACRTEKMSPPPSTIQLAKSWPSAVRRSYLFFLVWRRCDYLATYVVFNFGPRDLLLFTAMSSADGMGTFFVTPIFTVPISSTGISGHLPHPVFAFNLRFLSMFCCYFRCLRCFLVHGSHQVHCSPQNSRGFL